VRYLVLVVMLVATGCGEDADGGSSGPAGSGGVGSGSGGTASQAGQAGAAPSPFPPIGAACDGGNTVEPFGCVKVCTGNQVVTTEQELQALAAQKCAVIDGALTFSKATLTSLVGLESIRRVKSFSVVNMNGLTNVHGMEGLIQVETYVNFVFDTELLDLTGLDNLERIGGFLSISENAKFQSLKQLAKLSFVGNSLSISGNPSLAQCEVDALAARLNVGCGVIPGTFCDGNRGSQPCQ
jgi:hypothetical protein